MIGASHVTNAAQLCATFLDEAAGTDWAVAVPDLEMSVAEVVAHAAEGCLWYAIDLSAGGIDLRLVQHRVTTDGSNRDLIDTLRSYACVVSAVIEVSPASARGFHPMGTADPSGFAAMACDELLIHTDDAARGLGLSFRPPAGLADLVLRRLFPWVATGEDPWEQLRWANGRIALGDMPRLTDWGWHCAPIADWDGTIATRPPKP